MTVGGWRVAVLALAVVLGTAPGCASPIDDAHRLTTAIGAIDGVADVDVTAASRDIAERIALTLDHGVEATEAVAVVEAVTRAASDRKFTSYRLELRRTLTESDLLVVDETFAGNDDSLGVVENWFRVDDAFLGRVGYSFEIGHESIVTDSGAAIGHDIGEASRIGYGGADTTWRFLGGPTGFVVSGRVERRDVALFNRVQRTVGSPALPVAATRWRLERRPTQVLLDLEVNLAGANPERISIERWGHALRPLALQSMLASRYTGRPRVVQLSAVSAGRRDTFGYWSSALPPAPGRDRHFRGWDAWLQDLSGALR